MKIAVIGSGYVGTTTAALLAALDHNVTAIDIDKTKVDSINSGKAPFYEQGLNELIDHGVKNGKLTASDNYRSVHSADIIFSCVGTPDNPDGSTNVSFAVDVAQKVATLPLKNAIFVQKSTVPVGTGTQLKRVLTNCHYVANPEFLREGSAIKDNLVFDRVVVGSSHQKSAESIHTLYRQLEEKRDHIANISGIELDETDELITPVYLTTSINSAELIKVTANAFLALKISFANTVAKMADKSDADIIEVMDGIGYDRRIGRGFLNAGMGYGGGCFPKDVSGLISAAKDLGVEFSIMTAATWVNSSMPGYIVSKVKSLNGPLKGTKVCVLGLAYKPGTSDARRSPAAEIANYLVHEGAIVSAYDPEANDEAAELLESEVSIVNNAGKAIDKASLLFVATPWPEFITLDFADVKKKMAGTIVVDCMNALDESEVTKAGLTYIGVGR